MPQIYTFAEGLPCPHCGNAERTILVAEGGHPEGQRPIAGACEACSVELYWAWKKLLADAAPTAKTEVDRVSDPRVSRVKVLIARRVSLRSGELAPENLSSSYEMLVAPLPDGTIDLPTEEVREGEGEHEAVSRALAKIGVLTWSVFLDTLYTAYSPRGSLCRVYLARAFAKVPSAVDGPPLPWRRWPLGAHAPAMAGFYLGLKDVWPLILRAPRTPATSEICVAVRQGAAEYIRLQQQLRSGQAEVDTSMAEYLRRGMTDDEKMVDVALKTRAGLDAEASHQGLDPKVKEEAREDENDPVDQFISRNALSTNVVDAEEISDDDADANVSDANVSDASVCDASDEQLFGEEDDAQ